MFSLHGSVLLFQFTCLRVTIPNNKFEHTCFGHLWTGFNCYKYQIIDPTDIILISLEIHFVLYGAYNN